MYLGIDLGTSGVKVALFDEGDALVDQETAPLAVSRPQPLWSEQDPDAWWRATGAAVGAIRSRRGEALARARAIGLSGQMHGATLLGADDRPLRPAILWNDGRSADECALLEERVPALRRITGNLAMPGFTAPKLLWLERHEPALRARLSRVLLPKDYLRLRMTGDAATDLSDGSGMLLVDVAKRCWSDAMLGACGLGREHVGGLHEGTEVTGRLRAEVAGAWGMETVPVVAGGGDQAAGAAGAGVVRPGEASLSLGTSGVYFVAGASFQPNPDRAVHAFCHCLPDSWHVMSVMLSAASCLRWLATLTGADEETLLAEAESDDRPAEPLLFLPYLSGERTPHNDPHAVGVFHGLSHESDRATLTRAVLEGVAFAFADGQQALLEGGTEIHEVSVIGGGARSPLWGRILASALERPLVYRRGGAIGPAQGAARLARIGVSGEAPTDVCVPPPALGHVEPVAALRDRYREDIQRFRALYRAAGSRSLE